MDLHSGILTSLSFAVGVARAHGDAEPAHETLQFWRELIIEAREARHRCSRFEAALAHDLDRLIEALDRELRRIALPFAFVRQGGCTPLRQSP